MNFKISDLVDVTRLNEIGKRHARIIPNEQHDLYVQLCEELGREPSEAEQEAMLVQMGIVPSIKEIQR